jgi:hypothetical protein
MRTELAKGFWTEFGAFRGLGASQEACMLLKRVLYTLIVL